MIRIILLVLLTITVSTCGAIAQWYRYDYDYPRVGRWYPQPLPGPRPYLGQPGYYDRSWGNQRYSGLGHLKADMNMVSQLFHL